MSLRDRFRAIAIESQSAVDLGLYEAADGTVVDLSADLQAMFSGTRIVDGIPELPAVPSKTETRISFFAEDTLAAVDRLEAEGSGTVCVLNFASARSPGGGYLRGGNAQEEALCRATTLYPALARQTAFYVANRDWPNAVYADALIYSPNVLVIRDKHGQFRPDPIRIAVVTSPAPNRKALAEAGLDRPLQQDADDALSHRVALILATALWQGHSSIVLGAWGCGVFGNPPDLVADLFAKALSGPFRDCFRRVHFAVPGGTSDPNRIAFQKRFDELLQS